jgi:parvulin-like peptidyl-prolyl isomerase
MKRYSYLRPSPSLEEDRLNSLKNYYKGGRSRRWVLLLGAATIGAAGIAPVKLGAATPAAGQRAPAQPAAARGPAAGAATKPATQPVDPNKVVLSVGDFKMTAGDFEAIISTLPAETQAMARGPAKRRLAEEFVKLKVLAVEAKRQGLDQTPKFKQQFELIRDNALASALSEKLQETLVSPEELKKEYEANKKDYEKVTARHILISTAPDKGMTDAQAKAKADDIRKQLASGGDFAALAKANSADRGSAAEGGALPAMPRGQFVPEFENVVWTQELNAISQPVKTKFGYHIIQTTKREAAPFEEVKEELAQQHRPKRFEKLVEDLKKKADPKLDDSYFGPAPTTRPGIPGLPPGFGEE